MTRSILLIACLAALALPSSAAAHSILNGATAEISYTTEDVTSLNCLDISERGNQVYFKDFDGDRHCVDFGINVSGDCSPGSEIDANGYVYDGSCPRAGKRLIRIDVGPREDTVVARIGISIQILGGEGADTITLGDPDDVILGGTGNDVLDAGAGSDLIKDEDGDDVVKAGPGNDTVQGGRGADQVDGGDGDDDIRVRDGVKDTIACGPGTDKVDADQLDDVAADCEAVTRTETAPPGDGGGGGGDKTPPVLKVGAVTAQRLGTKRRFSIAATMSESGTIATSGRLAVGGLFLPLKSKPKRARIPGQGLALRVTLSKRQARQVRRAVRRGKRPFVRMDVVATDLAGNSVTRRAPKIHLR
jgi:hypothetical protein